MRTAVVVMLGFISLGAAWAETPPARKSTLNCLYDGRSFSEGAHICIQKELMMACTLKEERPQWVLISDKDLRAHCQMPMLRDADTAVRLPRRHVALRPHPRAVSPASSPPCFVFNGKQYCE